MSVVHLSNEMQLVLYAIAYQVRSVTGQEVELPTVLDFDEHHALRLAQYHTVLPCLLPYVREFELGSMAFRKKLKGLSDLSRAVSSMQARAVGEVSNALQQQHIPHVFFKGVTVFAMFYEGFIDSRYSDDIDVLISPRDLPKAYSCLQQLGYHSGEGQDVSKLVSFVERHAQWYRWRDIGLQKSEQGNERIDLHWRLADSFNFPIDTDTVISNKTAITILGNDIPSLPFAFLFVYVCVHAHLDYFFRLRYLVDIYTALKQDQFDYQKIMQIAVELGVEHKVIDSIATAAQFFDEEPSHNAYADHVLKRYHDAGGFPKRAHPHQQQWTRQDKRQYLLQQIQCRSNNSAWYEPLLARCKYNETMVSRWPTSLHPAIWYPGACLSRLLT